MYHEVIIAELVIDDWYKYDRDDVKINGVDDDDDCTQQ